MFLLWKNAIINNEKLPLVERLIELLLTWSYNNFSYNRKQSLKTIYESCCKLADGELDSLKFKERIENYFRVTDTSFILQHISENPNDIKAWFKVFYEKKDSDENSSNNLISLNDQEKLRDNLSRFLESYMYNTGLDFISGVIRLLVDDFENADGKDRFESSFKQIMKFSQDDFNYVFTNLLTLGAVMSPKSKNELAIFVLTYFPDNKIILKQIQSALGDEFTTELLLSSLNSRLTLLNKSIYGELEQIR